ncbi:MAG: hypothetical protein PSU94_05990 [Lacunisphaera sp.]|nr:hypothetical protein [Lacunisphaera sp.]
MPDNLTINWPYLLAALAMLWFPRQWLRTGRSILKRRRKPDGALERLAGIGARDPDDRSVQAGKEFANFRNYVDLFRALAGGYCLVQYGITASDVDAAQIVFLVQSLVLLIAVLIQTIRIDERVSYYAAIFYFVGLNVGVSGHYAGLFAFALTLAINPVIPNPRMFLTAYALLMLPFGFAFNADYQQLAVNVGLVLLIPLLSLLTKRPVVIFSRKSKATAVAT